MPGHKQNQRRKTPLSRSNNLPFQSLGWSWSCLWERIIQSIKITGAKNPFDFRLLQCQNQIWQCTIPFGIAWHILLIHIANALIDIIRMVFVAIV
jgi:hypothetical protein